MDPSSSCVVLQQPKYIQNVGAAVRGCSCFGVPTLLWTGERVKLHEVERLPRELRMKAYKDVEVIHSERPFDLLGVDVVPVCVEFMEDAIPLTQFVHPLKAAYVFGPEDGDVSQVFRRLCYQFVRIPSRHCLNLAAAINVVLYDRQTKG